MEDSFAPSSSVGTSDPQEMSEVASDQHSDEVVKRVAEYDIITDPPSKFRKDRYARKNERQRSRTTETGIQKSRLKNEEQISAFPLTLSPTHQTRYHAVRDEREQNEMQMLYQQEGYNIYDVRRATIMSGGGDIIDGMSLSYNEDDGFVAIDLINSDMSVTKALEVCTKYVIRPYNVFLKIIGWRGFNSPHGDVIPWYKKICNVVYPIFIFLMLTFASLAQIAACFSRTEANLPPKNTSDELHLEPNDSLYEKCINGCFVLSCEKKIVTGTVFGDVLLLISYIWAFYFYRFMEKEHLSKLIQTTFLSCNSRMVRYSSKRLVKVMIFFLVLGLTWIIISTGTNVLRFFALKLYHPDTIIGWRLVLLNSSSRISNLYEEKAYNYTLSIISLIAFIFFDLLYVAVVINYITQCELLHFFIRNIKEKVRSKAYLLSYAVKELYHCNEYLKILNGTSSYIATLIFFIFVQGIIISYQSLLDIQSDNYVNLIAGILNVLLWLTPALFLVIQATRLTAECNGIRKLGLEIGARPFVYSDTPQLVLDSFVLYTSATNYKAKIAFVPMYPSLVCGFMFFLGLFLTLNTSVTNFAFAQWI